MAGGSPEVCAASAMRCHAAMEPRPDGRGKSDFGQPTNVTVAMPQWSPGLMAGGSPLVALRRRAVLAAAMEPRSDGRGKPGESTGEGRQRLVKASQRVSPQWSPGLMAGGSELVHRRAGGLGGAAMEPRPDGRGKCGVCLARSSRSHRRNGAPA